MYFKQKSIYSIKSVKIHCYIYNNSTKLISKLTDYCRIGLWINTMGDKQALIILLEM